MNCTARICCGDYLRVNLEPSILASPDGHRWALAAEALERCESLGGDELHVKLLKTIAVMDLFQGTFRACCELRITKNLFAPKYPLRNSGKLCFNWISGHSPSSKKFLEAHAIFCRERFRYRSGHTVSARRKQTRLISRRLKSLAGIQPIVAKRHYHETGAFRWFEVNIVPTNTLIDAVKHFQPENSAIGQFLLTIPTAGESEEENRRNFVVKRRVTAASGTAWSVCRKHPGAIIPLARELLALELVSDEHPELAGDSVARREVFRTSCGTCSLLLETELHKNFRQCVVV